MVLEVRQEFERKWITHILHHIAPKVSLAYQYREAQSLTSCITKHQKRSDGPVNVEKCSYSPTASHIKPWHQSKMGPQMQRNTATHTLYYTSSHYFRNKPKGGEAHPLTSCITHKAMEQGGRGWDTFTNLESPSLTFSIPLHKEWDGLTKARKHNYSHPLYSNDKWDKPTKVERPIHSQTVPYIKTWHQKWERPINMENHNHLHTA